MRTPHPNPIVGFALLLTCIAFGAARATAAPPAPVFGAVTSYPIYGAPSSVVAGDWNGDGFADLAVANASTVSVLMGDGLGAFAPGSSYLAGSAPEWLASGDLNGDGRLDLVAGSGSSATVSVLPGNGNGTFAPATTLVTAASPHSVTVADVDRDGRLDIVAVGGGSGVVSVLRNLGSGSFSPRNDYGVGTYPFSVTTVDLNEDGHLDIAVANNSSGTLSVLLGRGDGTFLPKVDSVVGFGAWCVAPGDLDADGHADLVVANDVIGKATVLMGDGAGGFSSIVQYAAGSYPYAVAIADLNGDGSLDLALTNDNSQTITVLPGDGTGVFFPGTTYATGRAPMSIVACDLDGDGLPDLAVAPHGVGAVCVHLNRSPWGVPTTISLSASPNPSPHGGPVELTASTEPADASGIVDFYTGTSTIGSAALSAGEVRFTTSTLVRGPHQLRARLRGSSSFAASLSPSVALLVLPDSTVTSVTSGSNPSEFRQPVRFTASVRSDGPLAGVPVGRVRFFVDGVALGVETALVNGTADSPETDMLPEGTHAVSASFTPTLERDFAASTSEPLLQVVEPGGPQIVDVRDVPNDQGGKVFVTWRCRLDRPGLRFITGYRVWRRVPPALLLDPAAAAAGSPWRARVEGDGETFWEALETLPAAQLSGYGYAAPTTQDSLPGSNPFSAYFVQALTATDSLWFSSSPDSGYSVDNLAPPAPLAFAARYGPHGVELHWTPSRAPDVSIYRLHRGPGRDFVPDEANVVASGTDTNFVDASGGTPSAYKLAAIDVHGNVGRYVVVTPDQPTAALATFLEPEYRDGRAFLRWYLSADEPVIPRIERRVDADAWEVVGSSPPDGQGYITFEDATVQAGHRYGYRLAWPGDAGSTVHAGEGWFEAPQSGSGAGLRFTNPIVGGAFEVSLAAPAGRALTLELFDLAGRVVASMRIVGDGARHAWTLARANELAPGIYLLRADLDTPVRERVVVVR